MQLVAASLAPILLASVRQLGVTSSIQLGLSHVCVHVY